MPTGGTAINIRSSPVRLGFIGAGIITSLAGAFALFVFRDPIQNTVERFLSILVSVADSTYNEDQSSRRCRYGLMEKEVNAVTRKKGAKGGLD